MFTRQQFPVITWFNRLLARALARLQSCCLCALVTFCVWGHAAIAFAQQKGQAPADPAEKSYVLPYVIVVLCIALGLLVVCRSGGRSNEPKLENLE